MTREEVEREAVLALVAERDALRAELEAVRCERDSWRTQCHGEVAAREAEVTALKETADKLDGAARLAEQLCYLANKQAREACDQRDAAMAEAKRLTRECECWESDARRAEAQVAALREALAALMRCAWHHSTCPAHPPGGDDDRCNCGYVDAEAAANDILRALAKPEPKGGET